MNGKFVFNNMSKAGAINTFRKRYDTTYAINQRGIFKAFTTDYTASTGWVPKYELAITGSLAITSTELNPFGMNTAGDGNAHGTTVNGFDDPATCVTDAWNTRSVGIKTPMTFVGYGYDIFGYPAPNYSAAWDSSGIRANVLPENLYAPFELEGESSAAGSDSDPSTWKAGPLDLRWDQNRKVWTCNYGVYPGLIKGVWNSDSVALTGTALNTPIWSADLRYDVQLYDGAVTGYLLKQTANVIIPSTAYKVLPAPVDTPCLIVHAPGAGRPTFRLMVWETPSTTGCEATGASPLTLSSLASSPLDTAYGGLGDDVTPTETMQILLSNDALTYSVSTLSPQNYIKITDMPGELFIDSKRNYIDIYNSYSGQIQDMTIFCHFSATGQFVALPDVTGRGGQEILVKDAAGLAGTYNINVYVQNTGNTIDGTGVYTINQNYGSAWFMNNGTGWYSL